MKVLQIGYGAWGKKVAASFPGEYHTLYLSDISFTKDNLPSNLFPSRVFLPFTSIQELIKQICPSVIYVVTPRETHPNILRDIPDYIPVLLEKPAFGKIDDFKFYKENGHTITLKRFNNTAVGHTFIQNKSLDHIKNCISTSNNVFISGQRINTSGPIRNNVTVMEDLGIHDAYLFLELLYSRYTRELIRKQYKEIQVGISYWNRYEAKFSLSFETIHALFTVSWIGNNKLRDWHIHTDNKSYYWEQNHDSLYKLEYDNECLYPLLNEMYRRPRNDLSPLQEQWQLLLEWGNGGDIPSGLHSLIDAHICQSLMEHIT